MSSAEKEYDEEVKQYQKDLFQEFLNLEKWAYEKGFKSSQSFSDYLMNRMYHAGVPAKEKDDPNQRI